MCDFQCNVINLIKKILSIARTHFIEHTLILVYLNVQMPCSSPNDRGKKVNRINFCIADTRLTFSTKKKTNKKLSIAHFDLCFKCTFRKSISKHIALS